MLKKFTNLLRLLRSDGGLRLLTKKPRSVASFKLVNYFREEGLSFNAVIDGGANIGQFARAASWAFPTSRIHSFEPLPDIASKLRQNLADIAARHLVYQTALGSYDGHIEFYRCSYDQSSSALRPRDYNGSLLQETTNVGVMQVPVARLDTVLQEVDLAGPVLLKLDLQGFELEAIRGADEVLTQTSHLLVETVFEEVYVGEPHFEELWEHLHKVGFHFIRPLSFLENADGRVVQIDALFKNEAFGAATRIG